jgi:hypothetical protein
LELELVDGRGVPPVLFGMTVDEAMEAMRPWGDPKVASYPGPLPSYAGIDGPELHIDDGQMNVDISVMLERDGRVTSVRVWKPREPEAIRVRYRGLDVFATPADEFLTWLRSTGHEVDGDRYFPQCDSVALGFSRDGTGGDDEDEDGVTATFRYVLFAPPGHFSAGPH